jgi:glycosyltransferase involved in cell wall biosynthesis
MTDLTIVMPVYNERETVRDAISRTLAIDYPVESVELLIVDDGSTDGTRELLAEGDWPDEVRVIEHERNRGKGAALRTGFDNAEGTYSAILDADLEYDPADLPKLMQPLLEGGATVVFGTRGFESHSAFSFWYVVGNKAVTLAASILFDAWLKDIMTCHKVMRTEIFRGLDLQANGFAVEAEITAKVLKAGHRVYEVPISYNARGREDGKKLTSRDGLRVIAMLLRCRLTS